jgi:hypothetical protein
MPTSSNVNFNVNKDDLQFILRQIKIAERHAGTNGLAMTLTSAIMAEYNISANDAALTPFGLRTVSGRDNNLTPGQSTLGAADMLFPRLTTPDFLSDTDNESFALGPPGSGAPTITNNNYGAAGSVVDSDPRIISNLIVDQTISNPAAVDAWFSNPLAIDAFQEANPGKTPIRPGETPGLNEQVITNADLLLVPNQSPDIGLSPSFNSWMTIFGQFFDHGLDLVTKGNNGTVYIPLQQDDPLFDKGADGVAGTADDGPNFMALTRATVTTVNGVAQTQNTTTPFIDQSQTYTSHASHQAFLREYAFSVDTDNDGVKDARAVATGKLLDGTIQNSIGTWADVKAQAQKMLGIKLSDFDVSNIPLLDTDQYGRFRPAANGFAKVVVQVRVLNSNGAFLRNQGSTFFMSGVAGGLDLANLTLPAGLPTLPIGQTYKAVAVGSNHAFLDDIARHAVPGFVDHDNNPATPRIQQVADTDRLDANSDGVISIADLTVPGVVIKDANNNGVIDLGDLADVNLDGKIDAADLVADDRNPLTYDEEMLNAHFATGDGRGNENIGLTAIHSIFHSEHNRLVEANKATILATGDTNFIKEWMLDKNVVPNIANPSSLVWDGERLFQAARFVNEMQYQHLVFEEFARRIQPEIAPFAASNTANIDPAILAEFAHVVYRFGHSMLTNTVDRLENDLTTVNDDPAQAKLLDAFLNPQLYLASGTTIDQINANLVRGLTSDVGNEIDEFVVPTLRSNLLGLPLDLAALNIARGRDTGVGSLNNVRTQLYISSNNNPDLKPYTSWNDFAQNLKHPTSLINFIAAYGTHSLITAETTLEGKRAAAMAIVLGSAQPFEGNPNTSADNRTILPPTDRLDFLNATGTFVGGKLGGLNDVDMWIGGLAEANKEFGGMLGSTFNFIFQYQLEQLQNGDRFYYLSRTAGLNLLNQLEPNTFTDIVMRNSELGGVYATHLNGTLFSTPDYILELDRGIAQRDYNGSLLVGNDPAGKVGILDKVRRDYTTAGHSVVDGNHDFGGSLRFLGGEHVVLGGTEGNDTLTSDKGIDVLWGDGGDDYLNAGSESDNVFGGDGDDIIEDPFGLDVLRGQAGNDVISGGTGFDLLFGDQGMDYLLIGPSASEASGGQDNDFILGGGGDDVVQGNEGDDWIEGGAGADELNGDNGAPIFNTPILGYDVLWGQGNDSTYDGEGGDDIFLTGSGVQRTIGGTGFDWAIAKYDPTTVRLDLGRGAAVPVLVGDLFQDRFDLVEALSGWKNDDVLDGDERGHLISGVTLPDSLFNDNILNPEGIAKIRGLEGWFGGARQTLVSIGAPGATLTTFRDGNILMGGKGNDRLQGKGGFDILDGDAWLNVRIQIDMGGGVLYSAESMNTDRTVVNNDLLANAGKVTNAAGVVQFGGRSLNSLLLDRTIRPGQLSIVRELLSSDTPDLDTAVYRGRQLEYEIEGSTNINGIVIKAYDANHDGFISVKHINLGIDDTDLVRNIERLEFLDGTIDISSVGNPVAAIETSRNVDLLVVNNQYVAFNTTNNTVTKVLYGGQPVAPSTFPGWSIVGAETDAFGLLQFMWKSNAGQFWWSTNSNNGGMINPISKEVEFQQDFNGDGNIGGYEIENKGTAILAVNDAGEYVARANTDGSPDINLKYGGVNVRTDFYTGWSIVAAEIAGNDVKQIWKHTDGSFWYSTNTDPGQAISSQDIITKEVEFRQDFNGDGQLYVENAGTTKLWVNAAGEYVANDGSADIKLKYGTVNNIGPDTYAGWLVVGAEVVGADLQQIWKSTTGQYWYSTNTSIGSQFIDILPYESSFGQDFNGDGFVTRIDTPAADTFSFGGQAPITTVTTQLGVSSINNFNNTPGAGGDKLFFSNKTFTTLGSGPQIATSDYAIVDFATDAEVSISTSSAKIVYNVGTGSLFYNENTTVSGFGNNGGQFAILQNKPASLDINNILVGP